MITIVIFTGRLHPNWNLMKTLTRRSLSSKRTPAYPTYRKKKNRKNVIESIHQRSVCRDWCKLILRTIILRTRERRPSDERKWKKNLATYFDMKILWTCMLSCVLVGMNHRLLWPHAPVCLTTLNPSELNSEKENVAHSNELSPLTK